MNANKNAIDLSALNLDELIALKTRGEAIRKLVEPNINALRAIEAELTVNKNHADQMSGQRGSIWENVFAVMSTVYNETQGAESIRDQMFADAMGEFMTPKKTEGGDKVKTSTAGQYASTARKLLVEVITPTGTKPEDYADKSVADIRQEFKDAVVVHRLDQLAKMMKDLRYAAKHATPEEWAAYVNVAAVATELYNPVKARKDKTSAKATADREIRAGVQQQPTAPTVVETVVGDILADVGNEGLKKAVN